MIAKTLTESADLAYEAGLQGRDFPHDWTFRGHLARAYWEGVAERERRWGTLRDLQLHPAI